MEKGDFKYCSCYGDKISPKKSANTDKCKGIRGRKSFIEGVKAESQTDCSQS